MKQLGHIAGYNIYICKEKDPELGASIEDFVNANGLTDFDSRRLFVREDIHTSERLTSFGHELVHAYMEKWGLHYAYSHKQRELMAQFFGSMIIDLAVVNKEAFEELIEKLRNHKPDEPAKEGVLCNTTS